MKDITEQDVSLHRNLFKELQHKIPHSIIETTLSDINHTDFNCFEYAFDLIYSDEYKATWDWQQGWKLNPIGADKDFVLFALSKNILYEVDFKDAKDGYIIVYFNDSQPTHAGKISKKRVQSKWGKGLLLEHDVSEVPVLYGNEIKIYKNLSFDDYIDTFIEYAEANEIQFKEKN